MRFKANPNLNSKPPETLEGIERCINAESPFILYDNIDQFVVCMPKQRKIVQVDGSQSLVLDGFGNLAGFLERVKFYLMAFDKFEDAPLARIEGTQLFLE